MRRFYFSVVPIGVAIRKGGKEKEKEGDSQHHLALEKRRGMAANVVDGWSTPDGLKRRRLVLPHTEDGRQRKLVGGPASRGILDFVPRGKQMSKVTVTCCLGAKERILQAGKGFSSKRKKSSLREGKRLTEMEQHKKPGGIRLGGVIRSGGYLARGKKLTWVGETTGSYTREKGAELEDMQR